MILISDQKTRAKIPLDDYCSNHAALVRVSKKIRGAEAAYQERTAVSGGKNMSHRVQPSAYTLVEFCKAFRVSRGHFYNLLRRIEGPRVLRLGRRVVISAGATAKFVRNEALTKTELSWGAER
jgi:hypothetical protein